MKNLFFLSFVFVFSVSCGSTSRTSESDQKRKACKNLKDQAFKEIGAPVQPPAFQIVSTHQKPFRTSIAFKSADVVIGINFSALNKLGLFPNY
jgi:hypothetical protein